MSKRMVVTLLNPMDGICRTYGLLVIAAINRPGSIEPALRRPGRLNREIEIGDMKIFFLDLCKSCKLCAISKTTQHYDILLAHLSEMEHCLLGMQVQHLATSTLWNEAALICLRRNIGVKKLSDVSDSNMTSIVLDGCYDSTKGASDCSKDDLEFASSSITYLPVSPKIQNAIDIRVNGAGVAEERILKVKFEDFEKAQIKVRPSTMRER